jgi:hypothetical protein
MLTSGQRVIASWGTRATLAAIAVAAGCGRFGYDRVGDAYGDATPGSPDVQVNTSVPVVPSCAELLAQRPDAPSGVYRLDPDGAGAIPVFLSYCEQVEDGGGWTLVLKIDGTARTFAARAAIWTDPTTVNEGAADLDEQEAKLGGYATISFSEVRLGMLDSGQRRWITLPLAAASAHQLFSGGQIATSVGREAWLSLLANPSLQPNCNREGLNTTSTGSGIDVHLGILGNNEAHCATADSVIGIGLRESEASAGNVNNSDGSVSAVFAYVMVR